MMSLLFTLFFPQSFTFMPYISICRSIIDGAPTLHLSLSYCILPNRLIPSTLFSCSANLSSLRCNHLSAINYHMDFAYFSCLHSVSFISFGLWDHKPLLLLKLKSRSDRSIVRVFHLVQFKI